MYDRKSEANEFVGASLDEARASALRFYGAEDGELDLVQAEEGRIYGAAGRVVVVAVPKGARRSGGHGKRAAADSRRDRGPRRDEGRGEREKGGRERRPAGRSETRSRAEADQGREAGRREPSARKSGREAKESHGTAIGSVQESGEFVIGVLERMRLGSFEVTESSEDDFLVYQIRGEAAEALREGDGRSVDALQLLANQAVKGSGEDAPRIIVDIEGDAEQRQGSLEKLALKAATRAVEKGRSVALDPMNARDRRMIHIALRDHEQVATKSIGSGRYRQVAVIPEGAPEYEEAREASRRSGS